MTRERRPRRDPSDDIRAAARAAARRRRAILAADMLADLTDWTVVR